MKNAYEIRGDVTAIFLRRRDGTTLETLISTSDLPLVQEHEGTWLADWQRRRQSYYVRIALPRAEGVQKSMKLHRYLLSAPPGLDVDHINGDGLDNRRENLRLATRSENLQNQWRASRNNRSSGVRGVSWDKRAKKWHVQCQVQGKDYYIGLFDSLKEAEDAVTAWRRDNMPFSTKDQQLA